MRWRRGGADSQRLSSWLTPARRAGEPGGQPAAGALTCTRKAAQTRRVTRRIARPLPPRAAPVTLAQPSRPSPLAGEGGEEGAPPCASQGASQGGAGRPPRHGGTPFALSSGSLAPPFAAAAARARVLALKQKSGSPPSHRNVFLEADEGAPHSPGEAAPPSTCSSRSRSDFKQLRPLGKGNFSSVFEACPPPLSPRSRLRSQLPHSAGVQQARRCEIRCETQCA